ncbi:S41 family peptidase [Sphingomonas turrisvirgatae]|uniref:Tail specific protease domain-containing protein n=1 Tax=Sphingomonas turrisvirgatae TaxID=1888892 RepID=A0A1E3LY95_9SPHN|nr:S41 family peptidase [Sphingomonas turrisvirgatae]ODP38065.1 hypothetical protein BFL28_15675 [Sphingomonas turrisvirgatae]
MSKVMAAIILAGATPLAMAQTNPPDATVQASAAAFDLTQAKQATSALADQLEKDFVFPDVAKRYAAALRAKLAAGGYDGLSDAESYAKAVTADLQAVAPDGHLKMIPPSASCLNGPSGGRTGASAYPPLMEQAGWIAPGIAYVRFNAFMGEPDTLRAFTAFLDGHAGAKALIIDARTHRGGGLDEMDVLFPRIFDKATVAMVMDTRASVAEQGGPLPFKSLVKVDAPAEFFRSEHRVVPATPASPWTKARIYYLTSPRTASAAEHLASTFKGTGRATLIGATTAGAGHYGGHAPLPGGYSAFIPFGRSYFPGGEGWEGSGVKPDVAVAPERALVEALTREGVAPAEAEELSDAHKPSGSMERRR